MTDRPTPPPSEDGDLAQLLRRLEARVSWLEVEGVRLLDAVAEEIQTRRVVVVDDDGRERIVLGAHERFAHVTVHARPSARDSTSVELFANDPADGDGAEVGLALVDDGNVVATLNMFEGRRAGLWIDDERPTTT